MSGAAAWLPGPSAPDLTTATRSWKGRELFWIVQHGIKYTGMPGWVALEREDEIWTVVFAAIYYRAPAVSRRALSETLGRRAFWLMFLGLNVTFLPMHLLGL